MLETLRLCTPVLVAKWTATGTASLDIDRRTIVITPNTIVIPSYAIVHTELKFRGSDPMVWKPSRWIDGSAPGQEDLVNPKKRYLSGLV